MQKIIAATLVISGICGLTVPALAYGPRPVEFDPAAELQRTTGSVQYPASNGGILREGRVSRGGSEAYPAPTRGVEHNGVDVLTGGSSRYPVMTQDLLSHPPTALSQDQMLTYQYEGGGQRPTSVGVGSSGDAGS